MAEVGCQLPERECDPYIKYRPPRRPFDPTSPHWGLLTIDMQYGCAHRNYGFIAQARAAGQSEDAEYYASRLEQVAIPNIERLQDVFRRAGRTLIHTKIESLTVAGKDRGRMHKALGIGYAPGSAESEFLPSIAPRGGEVTITKTTSSVFNGSNLDRVLRNLEIEGLVVCGCVTTGCVETAVRDAADLGYDVVLAEDACAAVVEEMHVASIRALRDIYAQIRRTQDITNAMYTSN